ncbi:hypothetical protein BC629DRAFT_1011995 [Irpex lacteus]|nr:hypothetical protein BC629DRAFT_1011995 [Irpex lacteus]
MPCRISPGFSHATALNLPPLTVLEPHIANNNYRTPTIEHQLSNTNYRTPTIEHQLSNTNYRISMSEPANPLAQSIIDNTRFDDPLLLILCHLSVRDILALSQTCRRMWVICLTKQIWMHVWRRDIIQRNLPHPTQMIRLDALCDSEMRDLVLHVLRLHRLMAVPASTAHTLRQVLFPQPRPITWVHLVGGTWLLVAMSDSSSSVLSLFSIKSLLGARSHDLLAQAFLDGHVLNGLAEVSAEHGLVIALELRSPTCTLEVLSARSRHGSLDIVRLARYNGISHLRALHGSMIGFALHNDLSVPSLLEWTTGAVLHLRHSPDTNGGTVAMDFSGDYIGLLTPRQLSILRRSETENDSPQYTTIASFPVSPQIGSATVKFSQADDDVLLRVCITAHFGIYVYAARIDSNQPADASLATCFTKADEYRFSAPPPDFRLIARPLLDGDSGTVSWLETLFAFSPSRSPVRLMIATPGISQAGSSSQGVPCFLPPEREVPALYAFSVRDYNPGLGLLVIGNMIGELAIYSLNGDAGSAILDILDPIMTPEWSGQELLSKVGFDKCHRDCVVPH